MLKSVEAFLEAIWCECLPIPAGQEPERRSGCSRSTEEEAGRREWAAVAASQATLGPSTPLSGPASSLPPAVPGT